MMAVTADEIATRWYGSDKGLTLLREQKAKALARRANVAWADVVAAVARLFPERTDASRQSH